MTIGLTLYRLFSRCVALFLGGMLSRRVKKGKEDGARLNERRARKLPSRPAGRVVWLHGASVGESLILLELGKQLQLEAPDLHLLFTSQTQTSANMVAEALPDRAFHQMAPIDTIGAAERFIRHWQPSLGIFAEGEIWPNLILRAQKKHVPLALVNARITEKSLKGWRRWNSLANQVFGAFNIIFAADDRTGERLRELLNKEVSSPGNLKSSLPPPKFSEAEYNRIKVGLVSDRKCVIAASTHQGEEALVLDALQKLPGSNTLIIAPRHPERGDTIETDILARGLSCSRRSRQDPVSTETDVLLADTLGEMGLWFHIADAIYLGGGHAPDVGGHNPLEALKLGKTVITGAQTFNFAEMMKTLETIGAVRIAHDASELANLMSVPATVDEASLAAWLQHANTPMRETLRALLDLLEQGR